MEFRRALRNSVIRAGTYIYSGNQLGKIFTQEIKLILEK